MRRNFRIVATNYYDGPTAGFAAELNTGKVYYFRVLAWDECQNQRIYIACVVSENDFLRLRELLRSLQSQPDTRVWIPEWKFRNEYDTAEADKIIAQYEKILAEDCKFAIGQEWEELAKWRPIPSAIRQEVIESLERQNPDDLADWLPKLQ